VARNFLSGDDGTCLGIPWPSCWLVCWQAVSQQPALAITLRIFSFTTYFFWLKENDEHHESHAKPLAIHFRQWQKLVFTNMTKQHTGRIPEFHVRMVNRINMQQTPSLTRETLLIRLPVCKNKNILSLTKHENMYRVWDKLGACAEEVFHDNDRNE
jgi:hypothetical protein